MLLPARRLLWLVCLAGTVFLLFHAPRAVGQATELKGQVRDTTGAAIAGAQIELHSGASVLQTRSDTDGHFQFSGLTSSSGTITARASGFAEARQSWRRSGGRTDEIIIAMRPAAPGSEIVVSAARIELRLSEAPGSTIRLSEEDVASTPALMPDDVLRQVPGYSLFRRSGSRTANPTSQGVSLRGLGASGASRALVLVDGLSLLDPFGGWVYWDRIPRAELASVEVFRGGASSLYGSNALGGVVQFITRRPEPSALSIETSYGNEQTPSLSIWGGTRKGLWDFSGAGDLFRTGGYILVAPDQRGSVDTAANTEHLSLDSEIGRRVGASGRLFARGNLFEEFRHNGTPLQTNDTHLGDVALGFDQQLGRGDSLILRGFGDIQSYNQSFSSIDEDRMSESLTNLQHVPAQGMGASAQWSHAMGGSQTLIAGADMREVLGASQEQIFSSGTHIANSVSGGRQRAAGFFAEDVVRWRDKWTLIGGVRIDYWQNFNGVAVRTALPSGATTGGEFGDRSETAFSPRVSVLRSLTSNLSATASVYRSFRAPTLNELYRSFRVGSVVTQNNAALQAERLTGGEVGMNASPLAGKIGLRSTFFWSQIDDPIANVTLSVTPTLIMRQRQNLGSTRSRGLELDGTARLSSTLDLSAGYAFTDATVLDFPANTALEGLRIPQVPRHQFTWQARYWKPSGWMLSAQGRYSGVQYDDDQNLAPLDRYFTLDLFAARPVGHGIEVFGAAENVFNQRYAVSRTPVVSQGPPVLVRIGLRYNYPRAK